MLPWRLPEPPPPPPLLMLFERLFRRVNEFLKRLVMETLEAELEEEATDDTSPLFTDLLLRLLPPKRLKEFFMLLLREDRFFLSVSTGFVVDAAGLGLNVGLGLTTSAKAWTVETAVAATSVIFPCVGILWTD